MGIFHRFFSSTIEKLRKIPYLFMLFFVDVAKNLHRLLFFSLSKLPSINIIHERSEEDPLLVEKTLLISSPNQDDDDNDEPTSQDLILHHDYRDTINVEYCSVESGDREQCFPEESNYSTHQVDPRHVVIAMPELEYSLACTSVTIVSDLEIVEYDHDDDFTQEITSVVVKQENVDEEEVEETREVIKKVMLEIMSVDDDDDRVAVVDQSARWIKHYSSFHRILLVGEGDFSFSACLAVAFGIASNMIATSLDSKATLKKNYKRAMKNIEKLTSRDCKVMHGIDATKLAKHTLLGHLKFDRIVYNFPFAGFFTSLSRDSQLRRHRRLVSKFLQNAKAMIISKNGEIHISHKTNGFHSEWNLESIASSHGLKLIEAVEFKRGHFPGYNTKRGFGGDNNFDCNPSKTYKFGLKIA